MIFRDMLIKLANENGSDLYLSTGAVPSIKFNGVLTPIQAQKIKKSDIANIVDALLSPAQKAELEGKLEVNFAFSLPEKGRFRVNVFRQKNDTSIVVRNIKLDIPAFSELKLPPVLLNVIMEKRGLILFVGATGSGKSTSLAALIDHRNENSPGHIITIEDPIEYIHSHKKSIINQREVGVDALNFHSALKGTLRQAPDVILIGEIRDRETMEHALAFAETGHLVLSTLHANNANQALDRIINFFPEERREQLKHDLGNNIRSIISQRLVNTINGGRRAAVEILLGSATIQDMIHRGDFSGIKEIMEKSVSLGMKTYDQCLFELYCEGVISEEETLQNADAVNNLKLRIKLYDENNAAKSKNAVSNWSLDPLEGKQQGDLSELI
ncbi:PilT/PilU family type 4a pilus ATPase [uncultured Tolumonas sp.]|uniref:PilT/PilU family type 4a pilus ATPase n=1 Tax=uncultured Tolumonas sp. TaxID=263765 RepID=UPI00292FE1FC|nr:PilT/PilU family type 4a pilus ATPase [uncultured Tolumonas sp.]